MGNVETDYKWLTWPWGLTRPPPPPPPVVCRRAIPSQTPVASLPSSVLCCLIVWHVLQHTAWCGGEVTEASFV